MFGNVIEWFLSRAGDRRQYQRRAGIFAVSWYPDARDPQISREGIGVEISPNGLAFLIEDTIPAPEYHLVVRLRDRKIPVRVKHVRGDRAQHQGKTLNRYMGEFLGIAATDWDEIVRYVNESPEPTDRRKMQNQVMHQQVDDAYALLPAALQKKIVATLVEARRLDEPKAGETPLIKLFYGGLVRRPGGKSAHRFNAHSRIKKAEQLMAYDTRFLIGEEGELTVL